MTNTSKQNEELDITRIVAAHDAGKAWAASLSVGDMFIGSYAEAKLQGFEDRYRSIFTQAALDILEHKRVVTDMDGMLIEYSDIQEAR